jgi:hypothetical protein
MLQYNDFFEGFTLNRWTFHAGYFLSTVSGGQDNKNLGNSNSDRVVISGLSLDKG